VFQKKLKLQRKCHKDNSANELDLWRLWMACPFGSAIYYVSKKEKVPQRPIHVIYVLFVQKEKYFLKGEIGTMP
jgi:hypothetical protein